MPTEEKDLRKFFLRAALCLWFISSCLRFWHFDLYAGLTFDDCSYATSGKYLVEQGHGYWGDTLRPFDSWWVALAHKINGISIVNVAIVLATLRSLGELFLIFTARRLFPQFIWAPFLAVFFSATSYLGALYGKEHLSSLLFTVPLALWCYTRYLDGERWKDWIFCSIASALVFLSHYNTIHALAMMLGFEALRIVWVDKKWSRAFLIGISGVAICFIVAAELGRWTYGWKGEFRYIKEIWRQISQSQTTTGFSLSDGFLFSFVSWEGIGAVFYFVGIFWIAWKSLKNKEGRRYLAFAWVPLLGMGLVWLRINFGFLSFPRLYVFSFVFLWLAAAGFVSFLIEKFLSTYSKRIQKPIACLGVVLGCTLSASHQSDFTHFNSANAELEKYIQSHSTQKMVVWTGNPHLAMFWFGWNSCSPCNTKEEIDSYWISKGGPKFDRLLSPVVSDPNNRVYLNREDLPQVCDLVIFYGMSLDSLNAYDARLRQVAPHLIVKDFYHGVINSLPIMADENGVHSGKMEFTSASRLPFIRIYDLRGEIK
jgi:hypothetical protein